MRGVWYIEDNVTPSSTAHRQPKRVADPSNPSNPDNTLRGSGTFAHGIDGSGTGTCSNAQDYIDVKAMVQRWVAGTMPNYGLVLRAATETSQSGYKAVCSANINTSAGATSCYLNERIPTLEIEYDATPTNLAPTGNVEVGTLEPELTASIPGVTTDTEVELVDARTGTSVLMPGEGVGVADPDVAGRYYFVVPEETLLPGHLYRWRIRAVGTNDWSAYQTFHTWSEIALPDMFLGTASENLSAATGSGRPVLRTDGAIQLGAWIYDVNDLPGSADVSFDAEIYDLNGTVPVAGGTGRSNIFQEDSSGGWQVPATLMVDGANYKWRVRRASSTSATYPWSAFAEFSVNNDDLPAPALEEYANSPDGTGDSLLEEPVFEELEPPVTTMATSSVCQQGHCVRETPEQEQTMTTMATTSAPYGWNTKCNTARGNGWWVLSRTHSCTKMLDFHEVATSSGQYFAGYSTRRVKVVAAPQSTTLTVDVEIRFPLTLNPALIPTGLDMGMECTSCTWQKPVFTSYYDIVDTHMEKIFTGRGKLKVNVSTGGLTHPNAQPRTRFVYPDSPQGVPLLAEGRFAKIRCDDYFRSESIKAGCVFSSYIPTYKMNTGKYPDVARHVYRSIAAGTPGVLGQGSLTRNRVRAAQDANRRAACRSGVSPSVTNQPISCDEYPFAATWQGAAAGGTRYTWSDCRVKGSVPMVTSSQRPGYTICYVNASQNSGEGPTRTAFLNSERVINYGEFYVGFTSKPPNV